MNYFEAINNYAKLDSKTGKLRINEWRKQILPAWLYFDLSDIAGTYTVAATGSPSQLVTYKQPYASAGGLDAQAGTPFEVKNLVFTDLTDGTAAAAFTVELSEVGETRKFMNRPVHVRTLCGTGQYPARLREPYMFFSQHNIKCFFNKISGGASTMRMYLEGAQYYPWSLLDSPEKTKMIEHLQKWRNRQRFVWPYWITTETDVSLAGNATTSYEVNIGGDAHFECFSWAAVSTGNFAFELTNPRTGQAIMNGRITQTNGIGTANLPTILPVELLLESRDSLKLTFQDLSGQSNNIYFTLAGRKINAALKDAPVLQCDF